jgi:acyl carrier protein phosphodiesterase
MNYLAHLHLADDTPASRIGSLLPDLLRKRTVEDLDPEVRRGAERHRLVDRLTDTHPAFRTSRRRLGGRHGLFSGILVDVYYDHCLARDWQRHAPEPLASFISRVYGQMLGAPELMPAGMHPLVERMASQDWLGRYATDAGMERVLEGLSQRFARDLRRSFEPRPAMEDLLLHREGLTADLTAVLEDLRAALPPPEGNP